MNLHISPQRGKIFTLLTILLLLALTSRAQDVYNPRYADDPASQPQPGVPKGEVLKFAFNDSKIYPGTARTYWVYIPAQYRADKPACLFVCMDGVMYNAPTVFDNLIAKGEMPVTIGVFVSSGTITQDGKDVRYNRSNEFDNQNRTFSHFILDELLPLVERQKASDGRAIRISKDAADHAIAGASSGAICAFTTAWQRPDAFSRVFSNIGTYVGMRGGDQYPVLIRKTEPKAIRIFLTDNFHDSWNPLFGNWYMENVDMEAAFSFAGYEVTHIWGEGGHDNQRAEAVFPDAMRWLWKGWPAPVKAGPSANNFLSVLLDDKESWQPVDSSRYFSGSLETGLNGEVFYADSAGTVYKLGEGDALTPFIHTTTAKDIRLSADRNGGLAVTAAGQKSIALYNAEAKKTGSIAIPAEVSIAAKNGGRYVVSAGPHEEDDRKLWFISGDGKAALQDQDRFLGSSMALSPDGGILYLSERFSNWILSYIVQPDGSLRYKERWCWLHNSDNYTHTQPGGMAMDNLGNLYVATPMGIQVCDQNGRVRAILTLPGGAITALCFGGQSMDTLYAICNGKLHKRRLKTHAIPAWAAPVKFPSQGGG